MYAPSPQQQSEPRPASVAGYVRFAFRWVRGALRPINPFRTATGIAVTGPSASQLKPSTRAPAAVQPPRAA